MFRFPSQPHGLLLLYLSLVPLYLSMVLSDDDDNDSHDNGHMVLRGHTTSTANTNANGVVDDISHGIEVGPSIAAAVAIVCGLLMATCGYKLLRPTMFACGFLVGGYIVSALVMYIVDGQSYERTAFWISFVIGGLVLGSLVVFVYNFGVFLIGAAGGVFLATLLNASFGYRIYPSDPSTGLLLLAIVLGLICGLIAYKVERLAIIVATALVGSVVLVNGVGYFIGDFPELTAIKNYRHEDEMGNHVYDVPKAWWGYLAAMFVVFCLGMMIQIKKTGKA
ncbi:unnamed protein product [Hyaloperonospora brassicae]|uniref:Transmembrane protein 198 n=1 Tax=Hyaloperonospora brassicae TaxID=162125 RepID=A0AAV0TYR5_HYABA|nr:unnamed protein product [Hyaloperonospora brassicae]